MRDSRERKKLSLIHISRVFAMIEALSRNVVLPIAGIILTFIACYELIEMITQHNNMAQFEPCLLYTSLQKFSE